MIGGSRYPITIITGSPGSRRATLLSNVLKYERFADTAVIISEYSQAGPDHRLIRRIEKRTRLLSGGCTCCNMCGDLVKELKEILNESERGEIKLDRVVIEVAGLADPASILFSILMDPPLTNRYYVGCMVCCLDVVSGELHLRNNSESIKQVMIADTIIITKTDIVEKEHMIQMRECLCELNPAILIVEATNRIIAPEVVLSNSISRMDVHSIKFERIKEGCCEMSAEHNNGVRSMCIRFYELSDWTAFGLWMSMLLYIYGERMMRTKDMVDVETHGPIAINGVQHIIHPPCHPNSWNDEERDSQVVSIMKDLEPEQVLRSLMAFQNTLGSAPKISETNLDPYDRG